MIHTGNTLFLGSLSSCPDKDIVVEALNFMLTDEVNLKTFPILHTLNDVDLCLQMHSYW
jgi:hypothetical protein